MKWIVSAALLFFVFDPARALDLTVVSYNVESDADTDPAKVVQDIQRIPASHIWGLVEVDTPDLETYRAAVGAHFKLIAGTTGLGSGRPDDRMAIILDPDVLQQVEDFEELSAAGGSRHPLLARFRVIQMGQEFWFVVNHLQRGLGAPTNETRQAQAQWLKEWAQGKADNVHPPAVVLVGDFSFDVTPYTRDGNPAFDLFMKDGMFRWGEPGCVADQSCPLTGTSTSEILFKEDANYCANERLSSGGQTVPGGTDHRPIRAVLSF